MSKVPDDFVQQIHQDTLNRIIIPKLKTQTSGVDYLVLQKELVLAFLVNDLLQIPHSHDSRAGSPSTANGAPFAAPINAKRIVFSMRITWGATATVGNRVIAVQKLTKAGTAIIKWISDGATANQTRIYEIGPSATTTGTSTIALNYPVTLQKEQSILINDGANIDANDTVAWEIDYVEISL